MTGLAIGVNEFVLAVVLLASLDSIVSGGMVHVVVFFTFSASN